MQLLKPEETAIEIDVEGEPVTFLTTLNFRGPVVAGAFDRFIQDRDVLAFTRTITTDWRGVYDESGQKIPFRRDRLTAVPAVVLTKLANEYAARVMDLQREEIERLGE